MDRVDSELSGPSRMMLSRGGFSFSIFMPPIFEFGPVLEASATV